MEWISIKDIDEHEYLTSSDIMVWQENLVDKECSRFQRGLYFSCGDDSFIKIYPRERNNFYKSKNYMFYDLDGDMCQITHFSIIEPPKQ